MPIIQKIKKINEAIPGWMKIPFSPVLRRQLINNKHFRNQYQELQRLDKMTEEEIKKAQTEKLRNALSYAYANSEYYKAIMDKEGIKPDEGDSHAVLYRMPLLTKDILKKNLDSIAVSSVCDFYEVTTGGTTGEPTRIYMAKEAIYREWAFVYHYWSKFGYDYKKSRLATFRGVNMGKKLYDMNPLYQEIRMNVFALNKYNVGKYIKEIDRFGADYVYGYPSAVYNFCRLAQDAGINLRGRFRAALLISENLYPFQEEKIEGVLDAPIAMFYGHSERAVFGERDEEGYAFNPFYGITEISEQGEPIVTSFINRKVPLIRYVVDDCVKQIDVDNYEVEGYRNSEVIYGKNGEEFRVSSLDFDGRLSEILRNYQFIQDEPGVLKIHILEEDVTNEKIQEAIRHCSEILGESFILSASIVDRLEYSSGGSSRQYKLLIQNYHWRGKTKYEITGHWTSESLIGWHGEVITAAEINFHDRTFKDINAYQFIQNTAGICTLNIVSNRTLTCDEIQKIEKEVNKKFADVLHCEVKQVKRILLSARGKFKQIVQMINEKPGGELL